MRRQYIVWLMNVSNGFTERKECNHLRSVHPLGSIWDASPFLKYLRRHFPCFLRHWDAIFVSEKSPLEARWDRILVFSRKASRVLANTRYRFRGQCCLFEVKTEPWKMIRESKCSDWSDRGNRVPKTHTGVPVGPVMRTVSCVRSSTDGSALDMGKR